MMYNPPIISPFEPYNQVLTQINNLKNISSISPSALILPSDLITISTITLDILNKISDVSVYLIKKSNDIKLPTIKIEQYKLMKIENDIFINNIKKLNQIINDVSTILLNILKNGTQPDYLNYIYFDIYNKHKLYIIDILNSLKILSAYSELLN